MNEQVIAERRAAWPLPESHRRHWVGDRDRRRIEVRAHGQLVHHQSNERPYFSLTGEIVASPGTSRETWIAGGAMGDTVIVKHRAAWAVVERVHLADDRGWPMHAVENAMHWAGLTGRFEHPARPERLCHCCGQMRPAEAAGPWAAWEPWEDDEYHLDRLARHLRCTPEEAAEIRAYVVGAGENREAMRFAIRDLEPRWQAEADAALAFLRAGDNPEGA